MTTLSSLPSRISPLLQQAGEIVLSLTAGEWKRERKPDASPVTEIDLAVEDFLRSQLRATFPECGIIGEERGSENPSAEYQWLIDPIDGTRALMAGFASYTILLALAQKGQPLAGFIYQPLTRELWCGLQGAATTLNGKAIRAHACESLEAALFSTTSPLLFDAPMQPMIADLMQQCFAYQLGGDAYAYGKLAAGSIDLIIESGLKPHDFMALVPVIEGAGGVITDWHGQPLTLGSCGDVCAAGDARLHALALQKLKINANTPAMLK